MGINVIGSSSRAHALAKTLYNDAVDHVHLSSSAPPSSSLRLHPRLQAPGVAAVFFAFVLIWFRFLSRLVLLGTLRV